MARNCVPEAERNEWQIAPLDQGVDDCQLARHLVIEVVGDMGDVDSAIVADLDADPLDALEPEFGQGFLIQRPRGDFLAEGAI